VIEPDLSEIFAIEEIQSKLDLSAQFSGIPRAERVIRLHRAVNQSKSLAKRLNCLF
jgi:hypothetical protein